MHRITGDGYIVDGGKNRFADEDLPSRSATQVTHQFMNATQEEIATVIEAQGGTLHADSETYAQMNQLNAAIDAKVAVVDTKITDHMNTFYELSQSPGSIDVSSEHLFTLDIPNGLGFTKTNTYILSGIVTVSLVGESFCLSTYLDSNQWFKATVGNGVSTTVGILVRIKYNDALNPHTITIKVLIKKAT